MDNGAGLKISGPKEFRNETSCLEGVRGFKGPEGQEIPPPAPPSAIVSGGFRLLLRLLHHLLHGP